MAARWLEDEWQTGEEPAHLLGALHDALGGEADFAILLPDGSVHHYAGDPENPVFRFRPGEVEVLSTAIDSVAAPSSGSSARRPPAAASSASTGRHRWAEDRDRRPLTAVRPSPTVVASDRLGRLAGGVRWHGRPT